MRMRRPAFGWSRPWKTRCMHLVFNFLFLVLRIQLCSSLSENLSSNISIYLFIYLDPETLTIKCFCVSYSIKLLSAIFISFECFLIYTSNTIIYIYIYIYIYRERERERVFVVGNGHSDESSNPGLGLLDFT